jgi:DNA mismatch repair protein MutS2
MSAPDLERAGAGEADEGGALAEGAAPCDLLYAVPFRRIDVEGGVRALTFAFSSGDVGDTFVRLLDKSELAPSPFVPRDFADDIFLREFVARCLTIRVAGHERTSGSVLLQRLVAAPPGDIAHTRFRQEILRELASSPATRKQLEKLHGFLGQFRDLASRRGVTVSLGTELRLALLHSLRRIIELLSTGFATCRSGLRRLDRYGRQLAALPGFRRLCELLDYEEHRGEVDVRIRLGFDGHVRGFQALERRANKSNAFYSTALGRFFTRLGFLFRGERVGTDEILSRLADHVFSGFEPWIVFFFQLLGDIEFYLAGLSFRDDARARGLTVCLPDFSEREMPSYRALFNPLLAAEGMRCVPCDLEMPGSGPIALITGPNSGGKTRLLQSLALAQLLGQAGLFVPAASAEQPWVNGLFASLIDRMQPDQAEGRLGTELLRIRRLFEVARPGSMVLMDELCSGTNPSEGEELQELVLEMLGELPPRAFITTHFLQFVAQLAQTSSGLRFLQAELDAEERPTYAFGPGVATTSLAHRVAERLGVTRASLRELMRHGQPHPHSNPPRTSLVQPRASHERVPARAVRRVPNDDSGPMKTGRPR